MKTKPYWQVFADDYHEFSSAQYHYDQAGLNVKYKEIGCTDGQYLAVFWVGKRPNKFIKELEAEYNE